MKTFLVLIDHSYSSFNAARYALAFAGTFESSKVIFYNSFNYLYDSNVEFSSLSTEIDPLKRESEERMADLQISLEPFRKEGTLTETITDDRYLLTAVEEISGNFNVDIIVAGSKNRSAAGMLLIGSRIIDLINNFDIPVLTIPSEYIYEPVMCAVLATDLDEVERLPRILINRFVNDYRCRLAVLNVDPHRHEQSDIEQILAIGKLHRLLDPDRPDYHYTSNQDISEGIRQFSDEQHAGLVIIIHKEHSFIHRLFYKSVERQMVIHSNLPVLVLKQIPEGVTQGLKERRI